MNNTQLKLATILYEKSQIFQKPDSDFWLPDGGTHIFELAKYTGLSESAADTEFSDMEKNGYAEITLRKDGKNGVRLLQKALDEMDAIKAQQDVIDKAKVDADAILAYEAEVEKIMQTAISLGYQIIKK